MNVGNFFPPEATPLVIFFAKNLEISIFSMRIISVNRGYRLLAVTMASIEALIWIFSLSLIVGNLENVYNILAFALAMGTGSLLGMYIEKKLALGDVVVQLITQKSSKNLLEKLRKVGFRVTAINGESNYGKVQVLFAAVKRKSLSDFISLVRDFNPKAFFTIEDLQETSQVVEKVSKEMTKSLLKKQNDQEIVVIPQLPKKKKVTQKKSTAKKSSTIKSVQKTPVKKTTTRAKIATKKPTKKPK